LAIAQKQPDKNLSNEGKGKSKSMYHYCLVCAVQLELTCIQERQTDKLDGMAASMSADLIRSMPMHLSQASESAQSAQLTHIESQGNK
jgi:hypothetical protein